jgi:biotin transport system substrate-specific component
VYRTRTLITVTLFSALTAVGGWLRIPVFPVPFTLQTLFVYLSGDLLGSRKALMSQILFLVLGLIGLPVFARGGGPGYVLQPSFGYLLGFPAAAALTGVMMGRKREKCRVIDYLMANCLGAGVVLIVGAVYLYIYQNIVLNEMLALSRAVWTGMVIFIPAELVKAFAAAHLANRLRQVVIG